MKQAFTDNLHLSRANIERLETINCIIEEYAAGGYRLTLRQLYYQLVSRDIIPNKTAEYAKLSTLLTRGRMAGVVDWNAIEDRVRRPHLPYWVLDVPDALRDTARQYRLDRMEGQKRYVEVWCEKDALSGILRRVTERFHVRLMVNRGYSSTTAMYDAANRFLDEANIGKAGHILYLGDHDPSGLDMVRDIRDRLQEFGVEVEVSPIALTWEQVERYDPPPNPAKVTDPRASWYISRHGRVSWEVDALDPDTLLNLVDWEIRRLIDYDQYQAMLARERADVEEMNQIISTYGGVEENG
jgi:hypothetical protein